MFRFKGNRGKKHRTPESIGRTVLLSHFKVKWGIFSMQ